MFRANMKRGSMRTSADATFAFSDDWRGIEGLG